LRTGLQESLRKEMPEKFVKLLKGVEALQFFDRAAGRPTKK
jgi:hypothetical protein